VTTTYSLRYREAGSGDGGWSAAVTVSGTSHELTGLSPGVRYEVEVTASSGGVSAAPVVAQRSTRCAAPALPTVVPTGYALSASDPGTNGGLAASWDAVTGAVSYEVRRRQAGTGSYVPVLPRVSAPATSLAMSGLDGTASYDVEVAAINVDGDVSAASTARTGAPARIASGGTVTAFTGNGTIGASGTTYVVHTFTTSNPFVLNRDRTVEHLIVAGGGGGGSDNAGGGGGGGVLVGSGILATADHPIVIGAGGAPSGNNNQNLQTNGGNSSFNGLTAFGGGQGGNGQPGARARTAGGSGGGGHGEQFDPDGPPTTTGAAGTVGQGFAGGNGNRSTTNGSGDGGGGGGAGAAGRNAESQKPGDGGIGLASDITGTNHFYGSGGGGGTHRDTTASRRSGAGGTRTGGGGGGSLGDVNGGDGDDGFGGGGGGSATTAFSGGAGGSGVVILRYALQE
jgi:hypothetical protein